MNKLPKPFKPTGEQPFVSVPIAKDEFVWVVFAGDYRNMEQDRDNWKTVAEKLARELGKVEYAHVEYEDLKEENVG